MFKEVQFKVDTQNKILYSCFKKFKGGGRMNALEKKINKIAGYRGMLGMTQKQIASYLGILPQSYSNKERGETAFKDEEKQKIKELLKPYFPDITIDDIFFS